jgi:hypothetical protein
MIFSSSFCAKRKAGIFKTFLDKQKIIFELQVQKLTTEGQTSYDYYLCMDVLSR